MQVSCVWTLVHFAVVGTCVSIHHNCHKLVYQCLSVCLQAAMLIKSKKGDKVRSVPPKVANKASTSPALLHSPSVSSPRYGKKHNPFSTLKETLEGNEKDQ